MAGVEIVVCEGDSEVAYVNELNRLLYRDPFGFKMLAFRAVCAESGHFDRIKRGEDGESRQSEQPSFGMGRLRRILSERSQQSVEVSESKRTAGLFVFGDEL